MPEIYFSEVEEHLSKNEWNLKKFMFTPSQLLNNDENATFWNRHADFMFSSASFIVHFSLFKTQFPVSNYTIGFTNFE